MRITNSILQRETLAEIQRNMRELRTAQQQTSTGMRIANPSDDPTATGAVLRADGQIRALEQHRRNIASARSRLSVEESVLDQLTDVLSRGRELAIAQSSGTANAATRAATQQEVDRLIETVIQLGNTRFEGSYLFGGDYADAEPFTATGSTDPARPPAGTHEVEIAAGQIARTNHDGLEVFVDSGVIAALQDLSAALGANDGDAVNAATGALSTAFDRVQSLLGEVGARGVQLDVADANVEALDTNLRTFRSNLSEVEMEEAISRFVNRQTALQAAFMATSRILQTTLTDYLR